jgi:hypothetical protein
MKCRDYNTWILPANLRKVCEDKGSSLFGLVVSDKEEHGNKYTFNHVKYYSHFNS